MSSRAIRDPEPRLFSLEQAAGYCGLSVPTFKAECPVIPLKIRNRVLYDRVELDRWIDLRSPHQPNLPKGKEWLGRLDDAHAAKGN